MMAIDKGNVSAMNDLGCMYQYGIGVERDDRKSVKYYSKSMASGCDIAKNNINSLCGKSDTPNIMSSIKRIILQTTIGKHTPSEMEPLINE